MRKAGMKTISWTLYLDGSPAWIAFNSASVSCRTKDRKAMEAWLSAQGLRAEDIEELFGEVEANGEATISVPAVSN
jgi:hypothetical protein